MSEKYSFPFSHVGPSVKVNPSATFFGVAPGATIRSRRAWSVVRTCPSGSRCDAMSVRESMRTKPSAPPAAMSGRRSSSA
jgi:hypothetical protein